MYNYITNIKSPAPVIHPKQNAPTPTPKHTTTTTSDCTWAENLYGNTSYEEQAPRAKARAGVNYSFTSTGTAPK